MSAFDRYIAEAKDPGHRLRLQMEKAMAEALIDALLTRDYRVSIWDGEEWAIKKSRSREDILNSMFSTDSDTVCYGNSKYHSGEFNLVYGNSGWDLVSDHTSNTVCDEIWANVITPLADKMEAGTWALDELSPAERDTILAALRLWQFVSEQDRLPPSDQMEAILEIAKASGEMLGVEAIDELCERLNA